MRKKIFGWNIDLTHQCLLGCSGCGRTQDIHLIKPKTHLPAKVLKDFFHTPSEQVGWMEFEGCFGDPIYNPEFHEIAEHFFDVKLGMGVVTNGMHRVDFWERVLETWPDNTRVMLSIDGLEDTNHIYRVNSKWKSIQNLLDLIATKKRKCQIEWKFIVFKHNVHQIEEAKALAEKVGIDVFQIKQARQGDYLKNNNLERVQLDEYFRHDEKWFNAIEKETLEPNCHTGDMHHITAYGNYRPCINFVHADQNMKSYPHEIGKHLPNYNIRDYSLEQINELFLKFSDENLVSGIEKAPNMCQMFCKKIHTKTINGSPNCAINRTRVKLKDDIQLFGEV
jgi:MoaA/NifB/PqqE/SkfB family radical SAM enzyme